ncbi:MAG: prephenate dehydrogenase [Candidatus Omnitrophica bacterium]|nr:prephenate dehydrogenase [Candidatus Omnitrophota bacterium]MDD5352325.1 prephenate dehydrogenase [Candidatus Omnitrophota bacterium]MDD5549923.1 prephenate dehydrogenase [Candidatus Omnitrophota bacterium]
MPLFNQISIIGVGLIGGSLAKSIKRKKLCNKIVGFFRNKTKLNKAVKDRIVDEASLDLRKSIKNSDLIILALPISQIINFLSQIKKISKDKKVIIMDAGSTKLKITQAADKLKLDFVGTHPLAGSEKKGAGFSYANLFDNSKVIITPTNKTKKGSLNKIKLFWKKLNADVIVLSAAEHDKILSYTSHLAHIASFCLIDTVPDKFLNFGASGLKDTTRIALSDAEIWSDIFLSNKKEVLKSLSAFEQKIKRIKKTITKNQKKQLIKILDTAKNKRRIMGQ